MGGEKLLIGGASVKAVGSPPHGRGKGWYPHHWWRSSRITPAWAGKRPEQATQMCIDEDHPRMGGEKRNQCSGFSGLQGSPPHGRGKGYIKTLEDVNRGITPAWAGKRAPNAAEVVDVGDHPRMGGEKCFAVVSEDDVEGSPPHGRGKVKEHLNAVLIGRITPAWAGKSGQSGTRTSPNQDHPRMGGEKQRSTSFAAGVRGSPPHGRGKVLPII